MSMSYERPIANFTKVTLYDSLALSDPSIYVDMCVDGTDIIRVCNYGDVLFTQLVMGTVFGSWVSTGIELFHNSRPGVDISDVGKRIWYQAANGDVCYFDYSSEEITHVTNYHTAIACAPVGNGCYVQRLDGAWLSIAYVDPDSTVIWPGRVYGDIEAPNFLDAVRIDDVDYIFTMDRNAGRTLEIQRRGDQWTSPVQVLPLDIVDNTSGFTLGYVSAIEGKIYVTGRLVRSNDLSPISMDIFAIGPHPYEFGRYKFLTQDSVGGKLMMIGSTIHYVGLNQRLHAPSTRTFGVIDASNEWVSESGPIEVEISDTERSGSQFTVAVPLEDIVSVGDDIYIDAQINSSTIRIGSYGVHEIDSTIDISGLAKGISGVGKSLSRLERWHPFQSLYMLSQSALSSNPTSLSNVLRVTGKYSTNAESRLVNDYLNTPGILYSIARASASIISRGRFYFPVSYVLSPRYGVGVNYFRESQEQVVARLGIDATAVTESQYGNSGIVAIYGPTEYEDTSGVGVYEITSDVYFKLASAPLTITAATLHWMQIHFVDGRINVSFRYDTDTVWTRLLDFIYVSQDRTPWSDQNDGHGFLYLENKTVYANTTGFSSGDTIIPVDNVGIFSGSPIVRVDDEEILCKPVAANSSTVTGLVNIFQAGGRIGYDAGFDRPGYPIVISGADTVNADEAFTGSCITATSGTGVGSSFSICGYDAISPSTWITTFLHNPATDDWHDYIAITPSHGYWVTGQHRIVWVTEDPGATFGSDTILSISPALQVQTRAYNGTTETTHGAGKVSLATADRIQCDLFETFSGDVDISIMDAFKRVFKMAGADAPSFSAVLSNPTISAAWTPDKWATGRRNFIADMTIPAIPTDEAIGFSFRHDTVPTGVFATGPNAASGYMVLLRNSDVGNYLEFWKSSGTNFVLKEKIDILFTPSGVLRFSAQDNTFSVWINEVFVHSFQDGSTDVEVTMDAADVGGVFSVIASYATSTQVFIAELCEKLPDLPIDTMSNGWSAITTIIAQRRIYFSDTPDGSIYCYQTRPSLGNLPDIVTAWTNSSLDSKVTRVRAEGVKIAEYSNWDDTKLYGDVGVPVNATYANSAGEVIREARLVQAITNKEAGTHRLSTVFYPGITSGDNWSFLLLGERKSIQILGTSIKLAVSGGDFACDMELEGIDG